MKTIAKNFLSKMRDWHGRNVELRCVYDGHGNGTKQPRIILQTGRRERAISISDLLRLAEVGAQSVARNRWRRWW